jgi:SAM-dependent methyltransferase
MVNRVLSDADVLARQYADDRNLRARQRLWEISRSEPELDFNRWSVDQLLVRAGHVVLDVGCGNGRPLAILRERGCTAVGVDASRGMIQATGHRLATVSDVQRLPFARSSFDAAAAFMMLYHVPDQQTAAAELRRVVKPGGVVVATTASTHNQTELREIVEAAVGHGWTWMRPSASSFHLENGEGVLGAVFDSVEVVHAPERRIFITDTDALADYVASAGEHFERTLPPDRTWNEVVEAVRAATIDAIAAHGALVVTARLGALVCC